MKWIFSLILIGCASHHTDTRFHNPWAKEKGFGDFLKWNWNRNKKKWPEKVEYKKIDPSSIKDLDESKLEIYFIHHATFLIRIGKINILTDPVFSERASPVQFLGPKRIHDLAIEIEELPKIDLVLISHNHYDHMDIVSLKKLYRKFDPQFIVPLKNKELLESEGIKKIKELDWWEQYNFKGLEIYLTPANHWSARGLFDRNKSLWGGFSISKHQNHFVYFAGDTGYAPFFSEIKNKLGSPKISILPIGASEPRWFMKDYHMNAEDGIQAYRDLGTDMAIGAHWGTFDLSDEAYDGPKVLMESLLKLPENQKINFKVLDPGSKIEI
jgi:L-ascorbate metabolism protein UlaG (beta-lactamase superfamily)